MTMTAAVGRLQTFCMTKVAIISEPTASGTLAYRAIAGAKHTIGDTPGQALDALAAELPPDETGTVVIVQHGRADEFFSAREQARLEDLMARWRTARDSGKSLTPPEQAELDSLVETELRAASKRTAELFRELAK